MIVAECGDLVRQGFAELLLGVGSFGDSKQRALRENSCAFGNFGPGDEAQTSTGDVLDRICLFRVHNWHIDNEMLVWYCV